MTPLLIGESRAEVAGSGRGYCEDGRHGEFIRVFPAPVSQVSV